MSKMRVAVIGAGIKGLVSAYVLAKEGVDVLLYAKEDYLGGHARTVTMDGVDLDLGFMVFNRYSRSEVIGSWRKQDSGNQGWSKQDLTVELVANPSITFMDEPTSGLNARATAIVMRTVRNIVDTGKTVVCTIHQPIIDIFEAFDELFLMKRGEEIYVGPLGHNSCHLIKYFEGIKGVPKMRDKYNPTTWMLKVTTAAQEENLGIRFAEIYKGERSS